MTTRDVHTWTTLLATTTGPTNDPERVEALRRLEELKCAAEALQAVITADLDTSQRAVQAAAGIPAAPTRLEPTDGSPCGSTTATNGQGLCQACSHAKQAIGWHARPRPGPAHTIDTRTPTGHTYRSAAPPLTTPTWIEAEPGRWTLTA